MNPLRESNVEYLFASARHIDVECVCHANAPMEIILVEEGAVSVGIGKREYEVSAGMAAFIPAFALHSFRSPQHSRCHILMFSEELVSYFGDFIKKNEEETPVFKPGAECFALADRYLPAQENKADYAKAQAVLAPLCCAALEQCGFKAGRRVGADAFSVAIEYINSHFTEPLTLENVARAAGIHPVTLSKNFACRAKANFSTYLTYLRCSYAAFLLKSNDLTAAEAAYAAGFGSIRSFNRAFLSVYGVTPRHYRAEPFI